MSALLRVLGPMRSVGVVFFVALALGAAALGQSSKKSGSPSSSAESSADSVKPSDFAIESEMLTYTAMDSEGTAVACGIGRNVGAADASCTPQPITGPPVGIVVVTSGSSALNEFQLWRTDISTMDILTLRANQYCPQGPAGRAATTTLSGTIMSMFPESQAASFAASLLSATAEASPLEGNILDRTLLNDVAGHLRALGVDVIIPDTYMPRSLAAIDEAHSPFVTKLAALVKARACLVPAAKEKAEGTPGAEPSTPGAAEPDARTEADKLSITQAIDAFLKSLTEPDVFDVPKPPAGAPATAQAPVISHLNAVLRADGMALELDAASPDAMSGANGLWYVLSLKALESGGTLLKSGNGITGTKTSYSGGAVGTYALFRLNGNVACSGVFFNYEPPTLTSKIPDLLKSTAPMAEGKLVGGCH